MTQMQMKRGDVYLADLSRTVGSEQGGLRPVLVIQNDIGNKYSPTVIVAAITGQISKKKLPTHVELSKEYGFAKDSVLLGEQLRTIDKSRLQSKICSLPEIIMKKVDYSIMVSLGMVG